MYAAAAKRPATSPPPILAAPPVKGTLVVVGFGATPVEATPPGAVPAGTTAGAVAGACEGATGVEMMVLVEMGTWVGKGPLVAVMVWPGAVAV